MVGVVPHMHLPGKSICSMTKSSLERKLRTQNDLERLLDAVLTLSVDAAAASSDFKFKTTVSSADLQSENANQ